MLRKPHEYDGHFDIEMRCADNTAAEFVVVMAAAVVGNAQSYSKSFSVQLTTTAAAQVSGMS